MCRDHHDATISCFSADYSFATKGGLNFLQRTSSNSTSKISVAFGGMTPG